jgi:hypothetical protein
VLDEYIEQILTEKAERKKIENGLNKAICKGV